MTTEQDVEHAHYTYYIDRHGVQPEIKGSDRESLIDFKAGYEAALSAMPDKHEKAVKDK